MTIQSAIYLAGNKRKLFKDIYPHLEGRSTLIDLFTGSGTVSLNCVDKGTFSEVIANDGLLPLYKLHKWLQSDDLDWDSIVDLNSQYSKSKEDYLELRLNYNHYPTELKLLLLQYRSNSNMMRWNAKGEFNMTWGDRLRFDLDRIKLHNTLSKSIEFHNNDFADMLELVKERYCGKEKDVVIYVDSPYFSTTAVYQEGGKWSENDNQTLFEYMDFFTDLGYKMVMSNVFSNRGVLHQGLIEWVTDNPRYDVHHLDISYSNSSFRKSDKQTDEVLIVSK